MTAYDRTQVVVWIFFGLFMSSFLLLGIWDLVLIYREQLGGNSASRVIANFAHAHPIWIFVLALVLGILIGHFFWGMGKRP